MKKSLQIGLGLLALVALIGLVTVAQWHQSGQPIANLHVTIANQQELSNLQTKDYLQWLFDKKQGGLVGHLLKEIDLAKIEEQAELHPWVKSAEVYVDNQNVLTVEIEERKPIARIFNQNGISYFLDEDLKMMPVLKGRTNFNVPVFTNVKNFNNDSLERVTNSQIAYLAKVIEKDSFWNAQITQVDVLPKNQFQLIPLLGEDQRIIFGDTSRAEEKLEDLMAFYEQVIPKIGWDTYKTLDLRFKDQIVAKPSLGITLAKSDKPLEIIPPEPEVQVDEVLTKTN